MPTASTRSTRRRAVRYESLDDLRVDAERLAAGRYETVGNWSFGQILQHLAQAVNFSFDGFPYVAPWPVRQVVRLLYKRRLLHKEMEPGFRLPGRLRAMVPDEATSTEQGLVQLRGALERFKVESPSAMHPVLGRLTAYEWRCLHLRHAELHMSFVQPVDD